MASVRGRAGVCGICFSFPERQPALCQPREQCKAVSQPPRRSKDPKRAISLCLQALPCRSCCSPAFDMRACATVENVQSPDMHRCYEEAAIVRD